MTNKYFAAVLCVFLALEGSGAAAADMPEAVALEEQMERKVRSGDEKAVEHLRVKLAEHLMDLGRYNEAARQWDQVTQLWFKKKKRPKLYAKMGFCYEQLRHYEKAIPAYEQALFWAPQDFENALALARVYRLVDLYEKSIPYYEAVLKKKHDHFEAHYGLAQDYIGLGLYDKALEYLKSAQAFCPPESKDSFLLTMAQVQEELGLNKEALLLLEQLNSSSAGSWRMGLLHMKEGSWGLSQQAFSKAAKKEPKNPYPWIGQAMMEFKKGRSREAERLLTHLLDRQPQLALAYFCRAYVRGRLGQKREAVQDAQRAQALADSKELTAFAQVLLKTLSLEARLEPPLEKKGVN